MSDYLIHYGVKGMKWGVRRYQNEDGTLTELGKHRKYGDISLDYIEDPSEPRVRVSDKKNKIDMTVEVLNDLENAQQKQALELYSRYWNMPVSKVEHYASKNKDANTVVNQTIDELMYMTLSELMSGAGK